MQRGYVCHNQHPLLSLDHMSSAGQVSQNRSVHLPTPTFLRNFMTNYVRNLLQPLLISHHSSYPLKFHTPSLKKHLSAFNCGRKGMSWVSSRYIQYLPSLWDKKSERITLFSIPWHFLKHSCSFLLRKPGYTWEVTELLPVELFNIFSGIQEYYLRIVNYFSFSKISNILQCIKER